MESSGPPWAASQRSLTPITVPRGQPRPQLDSHIGPQVHMACKSRGQDRSCRARPPDRSLVAEDRSAEGVRDRTGPESAGSRWVHEEPAGRGLQRARAVTRGAKEPQVRPPAQPPPGSPSSGGPEFESPTRLPRALRALPTMQWVPGTGLTLRPKLEPSLSRGNVVVRAGRATHVP